MQASADVIAHRWVRWNDRDNSWRAQAPTVLNFYCDDTRFSSLWTRPDQVMRRGSISACVEPNYSTIDGGSRVLNEHAIYRKRWVARAWQELGMPVIVDLHVADDIRHHALAGVPRSWQVYCTRWVRKDGLRPVERDWSMVCEHRGDELGTMIIYGGYSDDLTSLCEERGWIHVKQENRGTFRWGSEPVTAGNEPATMGV